VDPVPSPRAFARGAPCAHCRGPIEADEADRACPACGIRLHADCHEELRRCPTPGCPGPAPEPDLLEALRERLSRLGRRERLALAAVALLVAAAGLHRLKVQLYPTPADLVAEMAGADDPTERRAVAERAILKLETRELRGLKRRLRRRELPLDERIATLHLLARSVPGYGRSGFVLGVLRDPHVAREVRRAALADLRRYADDDTTIGLVATHATLPRGDPLAGPVRAALFAREGWVAAACAVGRRHRSTVVRARAAGLVAWRRPDRAAAVVADLDPADVLAAERPVSRALVGEALATGLHPNPASAEVLRALLERAPERRPELAAAILRSAAGDVRREWVARVGPLEAARPGIDYPAWLDRSARWPDDLVESARRFAAVEAGG